MENIVYLIGNAFRIYIYWKLINSLFEKPKTGNISVLLGFVSFYILNSTVSLLCENFTLNVITNIIPLIALTFLYEARFSNKIFVSLAFYVVNMMADGIMYTFVLITKLQSVIISSGIATVFITFLVELLFEHIINKQSRHELDKLHLITILAVPIGSIAIGVLTMYNYSIKSISVAFILIVFNILIFYLYDRLQRNYAAVYEKKMLEQAIKTKNAELEIMKETQEKINFLRHDFSNHLVSIEKYAEKNDCCGILNYIQSAFDFQRLDNQLVETENSEIDSIINYKLQEMLQKNIEIKYSIVIPKKLKIRDFDLNIILGNLLDNAMEAMEKTKEKRFFIDISFDRNVLYIHMENTFNGKLKENGSGFFTLKSDSRNHGIGLQSVKNVLENYKGDIIFSHDKNIFKTDVMLFNADFNSMD
jgi:signal transduction histidine kinase